MQITKEHNSLDVKTQQAIALLIAGAEARCLVNSAELYQQFITRRRASGLSERTIEAYSYSIRPFVQTYSELPVPSEEIEKYIYDNSWSQQKRAFVYRHLRVFCRWYSRRFKQENPMLDVLKPRVKLEPVRYLTKDEIHRLYGEVSGNKTHQAIVLTLLDTGIRIGELLSIEVCNLEENILQVNGKTGPRVVAISTRVSQLLKEIAPLSGRIFTIDRHRGYRIISYYLNKIGFDGKKGPHTFRHTFAVHALRNGMDIITVSKTMGHKTIMQTQHYLRLAQEDMTMAHTKFSPLNFILTEREHWLIEKAELIAQEAMASNDPDAIKELCDFLDSYIKRWKAKFLALSKSLNN